jgi:hypothetical protein
MENTDRVDLDFPSQWMNQAGTLGFSPRAPRLPEEGMFVTNPVSWRARVPSVDRALLPFPADFPVAPGLPNPGGKPSEEHLPVTGADRLTGLGALISQTPTNYGAWYASVKRWKG